jgi:hypothetical protein
MRFHNVLVSALLGGTITVRAAPGKESRGNEKPAMLAKKAQAVCSSTVPSKAAPHKNFRSSLTQEETTNVLAFLHHNASGLNLTMASDAGRYTFLPQSWFQRLYANVNGSWDNRMWAMNLPCTVDSLN